MTCRRAFDADLLAVLRGEGADADFVAHYPSCPDCAAEVRVWRELEGMLRAGTPVESSHPEPDALLAFVDAPATLAAAARAAVEGHLATCRACADEVRTLRGFDAARLVAPVAAMAPASAVSAPPVRPTRERPPDDDAPTAGSWLGRVVWHPAFAYALVAVLLVPVLRDQLPRVAEKTRAVDARRAETAPASERDASAPPAAMYERARGAGGFEDAPRAAPENVPRPAPNAAAPLAPMAGLAAGEPRPPAQAPAERRGDEMAARKAQAAAPAVRSGDDEEMRALAPAAGRALGERREGEVASAAAPPPAGASAPVLEIAPMRSTIVSYAAAARGVLLRVVPPTDLADGPLDVRVRGRANQHEIATRVIDRASAIEVRIPPSWLVPGDYVVTLQPIAGAGAAAGAPAMLGFTVRAPTAQ